MTEQLAIWCFQVHGSVSPTLDRALGRCSWNLAGFSNCLQHLSYTSLADKASVAKATEIQRRGQPI